MKGKSLVLGVLTLMVLFSAQSAFAQKFEFHPYVGGVWPSDWRSESFELKQQGIVGVKGGVFVSDRVQLEGNFGYVNHFEFENTDPMTRAVAWEFVPSMNFFTPRFSRVVPYVSLGFGGITGIVQDDNDNNVSDMVDLLAGISTEQRVLSSGDTFFAVSYGGGVKALNLWGPMGLRGEIRGRSMPNFYGNSMSWSEFTGGVTFSWGER